MFSTINFAYKETTTMHSFAKVALAAAIGIASAQASAASIDIDDSSLDIARTGLYVFTGDNIQVRSKSTYCLKSSTPLGNSAGTLASAPTARLSSTP